MTLTSPSIKHTFWPGLLLLLLAALGTTNTAEGQEKTKTPRADPKNTHWRKFASKEYGFSFWYPDTYEPSTLDGVCKNNDYRKYLVCLELPNTPDTFIMVTLIVENSFFVKTNAGGIPLTPRRIGHHDFYCGLGGSMGTGFTDECDFNLRNKALEFNFSPNEPTSTDIPTKPLAAKILKTFRVQ